MISLKSFFLGTIGLFAIILAMGILLNIWFAITDSIKSKRKRKRIKNMVETLEKSKDTICEFCGKAIDSANSCFMTGGGSAGNQLTMWQLCSECYMDVLVRKNNAERKDKPAPRAGVRKPKENDCGAEQQYKVGCVGKLFEPRRPLDLFCDVCGKQVETSKMQFAVGTLHDNETNRNTQKLLGMCPDCYQEEVGGRACGSDESEIITKATKALVKFEKYLDHLTQDSRRRFIPLLDRLFYKCSSIEDKQKAVMDEVVHADIMKMKSVRLGVPMYEKFDYSTIDSQNLRMDNKDGTR